MKAPATPSNINFIPVVIYARLYAVSELKNFEILFYLQVE